MVGRFYAALFAAVLVITSGFAPPPDVTLLHYWNFNGTLLTPSVGTGSISGNGELIAGTGQNFDGSNARNSDPIGAHLRANNPIGTTLTFNISTEGYENVIVKYETRRSGSGADIQKVKYTLNGTDFTDFTTINPPDGTPQLVTLDFSAVVGAKDNLNFGVRFEFESSDGAHLVGNNRFDNLTVEGTEIVPIELIQYWNFNGTLLTPSIGSGSISGNGELIAGTGQNFDGSNARNSDPIGAHLRANNPVGTTLLFNISTLGYENIIVKYETRRSGSGADIQKVKYTLNGTDFTDFTAINPPDGTPQLVTLDFSAIEESNDNSSFGVRLEFESSDGAHLVGNNRFDNFTVEGFSTGAAPVLTDPVVLTTPADDATDLGLKPEFTWESLVNASGYDIQISTAPDFISTTIETSLSTTSYTSTTLLEPNTIYYWRVRGKNPGGAGPFSDASSFTTIESIPGTQLRLNEVMSSNNDFIVDDDGDNSDWVEIYNMDEAAVDLTGFGLSDNPAEPFKWIFPAVTIQSHEYLLIWASDKNRAIPGSPLHTNYAISASGETITLTSNVGATIDQYAAPAMVEDISYGRFPDGSGPWLQSVTPTPGASNEEGALSLDATVTFSHEAGFYENAFDLELTTSEGGASILYTLDGSEPDINNLAGTTYQYKIEYPYDPGDPVGDLHDNTYQTLAFSSGIHLTDRSAEPNKISGITTTSDQTLVFTPPAVEKGTVVKARVYKSGYQHGPITTHTYFFVPRAGHDLPVFSYSVNEAKLFNYTDGFYVPGLEFDNWRQQFPDQPFSGGNPANFFVFGDTQVASSVEFFETGSITRTLSQDVVMKLQGNASTLFPSKSLRLTATGSTGTPSFNYKFFEDRPITNFRNIILRNAGNDFPSTYFRDAAIQRSIANLNVATQAYRPAVLYMNGEYWGLTTIRERLDEYYVANNFNVNPNNIDLIEVWEADEGDRVAYDTWYNHVTAEDMSDSAIYAQALQMMDVENFIDYQIAEIFAANTDWPGNNFMVWRTRNAYNPNGDRYSDGRFRWMIKDTDFGWGLVMPVSHNTLALATATDHPEWPNPPWATNMLNGPLKNAGFKTQFINRFADLLNTTFLPSRLGNLIDEMKAELQNEMPKHIARWNSPKTWDANVDVMRDFVAQRPQYQRQHILDQFNLLAIRDLTIDVSDEEHGYVHINTIDILPTTDGVSETPYPWTGTYFEGVPVTIKAIARPHYVFVGWEGADLPATDEVVVNLTSGLSLTAVFASEIDAPVLDSPVDDESNLPLMLTLNWNSVADAESYSVQLSRYENFSSAVLLTTGIEDVELTLTEPLIVSTTYYWRVRAKGSFGDGAWSEAWSFTTHNPPVVTVTSVPNEVASVKWTSVEQAIHYEVDVSATNDFASLVYNVIVEDITEITMPDLPDGVYYVRVRAVYNDFNGEWSETKSFEKTTTQGLGDEIASKLVAYPNPVRDKLQLTIPQNFSMRAIELIDGVGRAWQVPVGNEVDFSDRPAGIFYLRISGKAGETVTLKVLKVQ